MRRSLLRADPMEAPTTQRNPLFLPLVIVTNIAVIEAIVLVVVISAGRSHDPAPPPASAEPVAAAQPDPDSKSHRSSATTVALIARGTIGRKVRAGGFAMTVVNIVREPTHKELGTVDKDKRYLALLLAIENNTGGNETLDPAQFSLKDAQDAHYGPLNQHLIGQALESRAIANRETVRGYVDFVVPASAKHLTLVYPREPQPIHIDLEE